MKSLHIARQTSLAQRAFTLVELTVAGSLMGILGLIIFGVLRSGTVLSSQNTGINVSASRARSALDQIGDRVRYSMAPPNLINTAGASVAGSTADGIVLKKLIGSPYVVREKNGTNSDIPSSATQFCIDYFQDLPKPEVGDWILIESVERPERQITAVSSVTVTNTMRRVVITTDAPLNEIAKPAFYRVSAFLYRKQAFVFAATDAAATKFELRYYNPVATNMDYTNPANYRVEADSYRRLNQQAFFTDMTSNGAKTTMLRATVNSSAKTEYIARNSNTSTFTSVPLQVRLWSINR